ncbi:MAG: aminopeptidase, partial [Oscillospiraceae bacterium]
MSSTKGELLKKDLFYKKENGGKIISQKEKKEIFSFCENYKDFLNNAKTERHAVNTAVTMLQEKGFEVFDKTKIYKPGDKVYLINRSKSIISAVIGEKHISDGVKMIASHIDSPRLDLKPNPLYEEAQIAFLKTHYYGGIKKYQWTALPLALVGVIVKNDGTIVDINIGLDSDDPVFSVTDLLPHLASNQMQEPMSKAIKGEQLNIIVGIDPFVDEKV